MSIGLPSHLVPQVLNRAFTHSGHVIAVVCLIVALGIVSAVQAASPDRILWPAMLALVPIGVVLWQLDRRPGVFYTVAYIAIGGAAIYWYAITVMSEFEPLDSSDAFVLTLVKFALHFVGTPGLSVWAAVASCLGAYAVAEGATVLAAIQAGIGVVPDGTALGVLVIVCAMLIVTAVAQHSLTRVQPDIHRAARDEQLASVRRGIEVKAAAIMHDTVLNHLAAITSAPDGAVRQELRAEIERDLEFLIGEEWLAEEAGHADTASHAEVLRSELLIAVEESRRRGLQIDVSGDLLALARLSPARSTALGLAVRQCLANVLKHSGTTIAEVVIHGSAASVSVMVIDGGRGFSEAETPPDRLGLRQSVRRRIEAVDGEVQLWSTIGRGTSVMMTVPAPAIVSGDAAVQASQ